MQSETLSARDRRALHLGALLAGPALAWSLLLSPYVRHERALRTEIETERALLSRELGLHAAERELRMAAADGAQRVKAATPLLFDHGRGGLVSAAVGEYVQDVAEGTGVQLEEMAPREPQAAARGLRPVALGVAGRGQLDAVLELLTRLASGPKLVLVDSVAITAAVPGDGVRATRAPLAFRMTVTGYTLDRGTSATSPHRPISLARASEDGR
jgi:hypothetical protein